MGMIDMSQRVQISVMQLRAAQLISEGAFLCQGRVQLNRKLVL